MDEKKIVVPGERIFIFDTTLRDGEQSPGCSMDVSEKLKLALALENMGVDIIEAGFPAASPGDFEAVRLIATTLKQAQVAGLCMAESRAIDQAWRAVEAAGPRGRIHTFLATSEIHIRYKLKTDEADVLRRSYAAVQQARRHTDNVEFSCEDATRTRWPFLCEVLTAVIDAGARVVNIPDTVGYTTPEEYYELIRFIREKVPNIGQAIISVHCHNDLGMAVANSLAALRAGARQIECTINGIGERAGNCSLEEAVMAIRTRNDVLPFENAIKTEQLLPLSKLVSSITGMQVQANKAIVGSNAFAHESGIHQHGVLSESLTYEIMTPESVGWKKSQIVLGKHSGRAALKERLKALGYVLSKEEIDKVFLAFKSLCDQKKEIFDEDLDALMLADVREHRKYRLLGFIGSCGSFGQPSAMVLIDSQGKNLSGQYEGHGPVDAVFTAIKQATGSDFLLKTFSMEAVTQGSDAQATCIVRLEAFGRDFLGRGTHTDVICASAKAYLSALNRIHNWEKRFAAR